MSLMYVVIGGSGYLGAYFIKNLLEREVKNIIATSREEINSDSKVTWMQLDLESEISIKKFLEKINLFSDEKNIIYLSAFHHPDKVLEEPERAFNINITGLSKIINGIKSIKNLFYASTDSVYGESHKSYQYKEDDNTRPENEYGKQKALAEEVVLLKGFSVARYSFLIGKSLVQKKHFYDKIIDDLKEKKEISLLADSYRSAIDFDQASNLTLDLIEKGEKGIFNICGDEGLSKFDVGMIIAQENNLDHKTLKEMKFADADFFIAKRAQNTLMSNRKLKMTLGLDEVLLHRSS